MYLSTYDWVIIAAVVFPLFFLVVNIVKRKRRLGHPDTREAALGQKAEARGIRVEHDSREDVLSVQRSEGVTTPIPMGRTQLSGETEGVKWVAEVQAIPEVEDQMPRGRISRQWTRLKASEPGMPPGQFVLIMTLPEGVKAPPKSTGQEKGFLAAIARKASAAAFSIYVNGYFGAEHQGLVNLELASPLDVGPGFAAFTNGPAFAQRLMDAPALELVAAMAAAERARPGAKHAGFGILFVPDGVVLGTQLALPDAEQLEPLARFAALFAKRAAQLRSA